MKNALLAALLFCFTSVAMAQDLSRFHLYNPGADAAGDINTAIAKAKASGKHVLVQVGGNWCIWCARFHDFISNDRQIDSLVQADYIVYHLNYSKENKNLDILAKFGYPQRFGFPVFLVLDSKGNRIHTQNSSYLEAAKSYNRESVMGFLMDWRPAAFDPKQYQEN